MQASQDCLIKLPVVAETAGTARVLAQYGFQAEGQTDVMETLLSLRSDVENVRLTEAPSDRWVDMHVSDPGAAAAFRTAVGVPGSVYADYQGHAIGRGVLVDQTLWISAMGTHPSHRRRGYGQTILTALMGWATSNGATTARLQVEVGNDAAIALYEPFGFETIYTYAYWRRS